MLYNILNNLLRRAWLAIKQMSYKELTTINTCIYYISYYSVLVLSNYYNNIIKLNEKLKLKQWNHESQT